MRGREAAAGQHAKVGKKRRIREAIREILHPHLREQHADIMPSKGQRDIHKVGEHLRDPCQDQGAPSAKLRHQPTAGKRAGQCRDKAKDRRNTRHFQACKTKLAVKWRGHDAGQSLA